MMQQLAKFLSATGRRLRTLGKILCHLFRKGKLAIKNPFFADVEFNIETEWERRQ